MVGIIGAVLTLKPWESGENEGGYAPSVEAGKGEGVTDKESELEDKTEELDINSELVQDLYRRINVSGSPHAGLSGSFFWLDLLHNGGSDDVVLKIAFLNTEDGACRGNGYYGRKTDIY